MEEKDFSILLWNCEPCPSRGDIKMFMNLFLGFPLQLLAFGHTDNLKNPRFPYIIPMLQPYFGSFYPQNNLRVRNQGLLS